jgi:xylulokinase
MKFLGIDVGTGGSRALLIDASGEITASATADHAPFSSTHAGWAEQDPRDWWAASKSAIRAVLTKEHPDAIKAIGLSGQMHGLVLLNHHDEVLRPSIIWCDQRTNAQCLSLNTKVGAERIIKLTCNPALTNFTLLKMLWVREIESEIWQQARAILLPKDYVRLKLSGERATDVSDASGTLLLDVAGRKWSAEMIAASEIDERMLPALYESPVVCGVVSKTAADATGLLAGTPIVAGAGDQAAGAIGMGVVHQGNVSATIGTSGVVFAATDRPALDLHGRVHTFCHAVPNRWHVMGVTQGAGLSLRWFRDQFGAGADDERDPYVRLTEEAANAPAGSDGVLWAPYLMGERTPHLDPLARAALVGLKSSHTRAHIVRALLEGVAFSLRDTFEIFHEMKVPVNEIRLGGGGARSPLWQQIQADIYNHDVNTVSAEEGAAFGAAILAGVGVGAWSSVDAACEAVVHVSKRIERNAETAQTMNEQYRSFKALYPALRQIARRS